MDAIGQNLHTREKPREEKTMNRGPKSSSHKSAVKGRVVKKKNVLTKFINLLHSYWKFLTCEPCMITCFGSHKKK